MLRKLLVLAFVVAGALAAAMPNAYAQGAASLPTVESLNQTSQVWRTTRSTYMRKMRVAQEACDEKEYNYAKETLLRGVDSQITTIDHRLNDIRDASSEQRVRDQRLGVELIFERERLTKLRAMYRVERFVPCDPEEDVAVEYVRICDTYGTGFFYIPGTETCLRLAEPVERRTVRAGNNGDVCDALGLSGLTISSDDNCRGIENYSPFFWGAAPKADAAKPQLTDGLDFWNFGANFQPSLTFGGMQTRGAFATETPAPELVVPGYNFDTSYQGSGIKAELFGSLSIGGFPISLKAGIGFDNATAATSASDVAFPEGFGIPGVGAVSGAFINSPTDMVQFDFTAQRQQISAFFEAGFPITEGQFMLADMAAGYRVGGLVGIRGGSFTQHEMTTAVTSSPAFPTPGATSTYETDFTGGFGGLYAGVSLDKNIPFGDDGLSVQEMFSLAAGYDMYRLDITDRVVATGLAGFGGFGLNDTNSFSYSGGIPTLKLDASIGVGTANWMAGIYTGLSVGKTALISYERLDDGQNPHTSLAPELGFSIGVNFTGRF